ncbi:RNA polymerase sigma factor [Stenotrophomonas acidaminiphila]|uniref:RNA polymerase sigma factor n=1 Tax=Stenotrophomonas acidaminiphila TaxID=128780 RepID=UPI0015FB113B|nr:sigma-70 family RNA polymerase sigma factor [Stenotrophomonas acidaminiphila]
MLPVGAALRTLSGTLRFGILRLSASRAPVDGVTRAPAGDGFSLFLRTQREPLRVFLRARGASEEDAEDIVQDCMERLIRYREHPHAELKLLLYRIARNRLADRGRSPHAAPHLPLAEQDLPSEAPFSTPGPLRQAESGQMLNALRQALLKLPERCREVYLLNRITGMSYSQIARHRGITAKTVEKHVARALQGLRRELGADAFGMGGDE